MLAKEGKNEVGAPLVKIAQKLPLEVCSNICADFQRGVKQIFADNLVFGFICGGVAKGYADDTHDIDIVVCTEEPMTNETTELYYDWYFDLHDRYSLPPDYDYPGETVTYQQFSSTLELLIDLELTLHVTDIQLKKAIIWGDMITGGIAGEVGNVELIDQIIQKYKDEPALWKEQVLRLIPQEEKEQWVNVSHTLIMEKYMKYPKHDGKKLETRYKRK